MWTVLQGEKNNSIELKLFYNQLMKYTHKTTSRHNKEKSQCLNGCLLAVDK